MSVEDHFAVGAQAFENEDWFEAAKNFCIITKNYLQTPYGPEAFYYLGISYFSLEELDFANDAFTEYLRLQNNPRFFEESICYKFAIAEKFSAGAKRRFFGTKKLPKWASGKNMALQIYDEVIAAVPCNEIAAQALVSKGYLLWKMKDYRLAVDAFQLVIKRFPKHELTPECYLLISKIYLEQSRYEFQNPDILAFAQINLLRFSRDFPREERLCIVEQDVMGVKEIYAKGLYDTGQFYERVRKPLAAKIYYHNAIKQFPETCIAELCRVRMLCMDPSYCDPSSQDNNSTSSDEEVNEEEELETEEGA
jgi:outer membrane protein assembly factor BamD (BamD/ComL family)